MQITVLMENGGREGLCAEQGLSLYVRSGGTSLLLVEAAPGKVRAIHAGDVLEF